MPRIFERVAEVLHPVSPYLFEFIATLYLTVSAILGGGAGASLMLICLVCS
jgi:hypothetical protein